MEWTRLDRLAEHAWHKPRTRELRDELNREIQTVLDNRSYHDQRQTELMEADHVVSEQLSPDLAVMGLAEILEQERKMRDRLAEFFALENRDRTAALDKAIKAHGAKQAEIRERLVSIGYVDVPPTQQVVGKITPGMVLCHPQISAARDLVNELRSRPDTGRMNEQAAEQCRQQLQQLKRRALGLAAA